MLTRTREKPEEKDSLPLPDFIPADIQKDITTKGFHLYNWISPSEVRASIQRDYLRILSKAGIWIGAIGIVGALLVGGLNPLGFLVFFAVVGVSYAMILLYLSMVALRRSVTLTNTANIVLTEKAFSIGGDIIPYARYNEYADRISRWEKEFDEPLFGSSNIMKHKSALFQDTLSSIGSAWSWIFRIFNSRGSRSRQSGQLVLIAVVLGAIYTVVTALVYSVGLFFIWLFSLLLTIMNRAILRLTGHEVQLINDEFSTIDALSTKLDIGSRDLSKYLMEARKNEWKDSLLTKIKEGIEAINTSANRSIEASISLRRRLENSKYNDIFNFTTYNRWIKTEITGPLEHIQALLEENQKILISTIEGLDEQIKETQNPSHQGPLDLQRARLIAQSGDFEKYGDLIQSYLDKLKI